MASDVLLTDNGRVIIISVSRETTRDMSHDNLVVTTYKKKKGLPVHQQANKNEIKQI